MASKETDKPSGSKKPNMAKNYAAASSTRSALKKQDAPSGRKPPAKKRASEPATNPPIKPDVPGEVWEVTGMPITLIGPPVPPGQAAHLVPGFQGGLHFYNPTTRQTMTREGDGWVCSTRQIAAERDEDQVGTVLERCAGKFFPIVAHDKHLAPLRNFTLNELIHKLAINTFVAIMAQDMLVGQLRLADNHLRKIILLKTNDGTVYIDKFTRVWKNIVIRRSPYYREHTRFPHRRAPIMEHPVSDFGAAMELTIWFVWTRAKNVIACIKPAIELGYQEIRDRPLPDRTKEYQRKLRVPGEFSSSFSFSYIYFLSS